MKPLEHNGKQYSNADAWRSAKSMSSPKVMHAPGAEEHLEPGEENDPHAVREEHGPAHEVHITHEHEMGAHHVHSVHADGHEHHSDHDNAAAAHEHAANLAIDDAEHSDMEGEKEDGYDREY